MAGGIDGFLYHTIAFGAASEQILTIEVDDIENGGVTIESTTSAIEPLMDIILDFLDDYELTHKCKHNYFAKLVLGYKNWIKDNGEDEWMRNSRWIGVTANNLKKMLNDRRTISDAKHERWEQMWMIYFGLKSAIGRKKYVQISWNFILIRAMGFFNTQQYNDYFKGQPSWITPLMNRKAKERMIERLKNNFNLVYATHRPTKGEHPEVAQWSFQKGFKWIAKTK